MIDGGSTQDLFHRSHVCGKGRPFLESFFPSICYDPFLIFFLSLLRPLLRLLCLVYPPVSFSFSQRVFPSCFISRLRLSCSHGYIVKSNKSINLPSCSAVLHSDGSFKTDIMGRVSFSLIFSPFVPLFSLLTLRFAPSCFSTATLCPRSFHPHAQSPAAEPFVRAPPVSHAARKGNTMVCRGCSE